MKENKFFIFDRDKRINFRFILNLILFIPLRWFYKIKIAFVHPTNKAFKLLEKNNKYKLSICAIFQNEAPYLKEWIEYHKIVGVEHFYLYNNFSTDNYLEILAPYIKKRIVTLTDWPIQQGQMASYKHCVDTYGKETQWIGFIDLDEFVVPNKPYNTIPQFLNKFKKKPIVIVYWKLFGTSGYIYRDTKNPVIKDFTQASYKYLDIGKIFFNTAYDYQPKFAEKMYMHHRWAGFKGFKLPPVNEFGKICLNIQDNPVSISTNPQEFPIQINHYLLKSFNEYKERKAIRGGGVNPVGVHDMIYFNTHEKRCTKTDISAQRYLPQLMKALNTRNEI